jgi:hypothetical protein
MSTIRKTISISKKDKKLQDIVENVPSYEVSHVIRQLMYDGLKYRALVEQGMINDINVQFSVPNSPIIEGKREEKPHIVEESYDFDEEIDFSTVKLEEIDENDEDLEDILLKNS